MKEIIDEFVKDNGDIVLGHNSSDALLTSIFKEGDKVKITIKDNALIFEKVDK